MTSIDTEISRQIQQKLDCIEEAENVRILYACESGSRAWGFASQDSDYDVRFIYVRRQDWYLAINVESKRDVIELPIDKVFDISGWDLRKALSLFQRSNPSIHEWVQSSLVYRKNDDFLQRIRQVATESFNPISIHHHYLRMATRQFERYLKGELVNSKKYLYVLRPLLAVRWIERQGCVVPIEFEDLWDDELKATSVYGETQQLLEEKRNGLETDCRPRRPVIDDFIQEELRKYSDRVPESSGVRIRTETLNELFREFVTPQSQ